MHDLNVLAAYVEGRLDERERARTTAHLATCAECRATLAELVRGEAVATGAVRSGPLRWSRATWLPLAAGLAVATIVGVNLLQRQPPRPAASPEVGGPASTEPSPAPPTTGSPAPSTLPAPHRGEDDDLLVKRGGVRRSVAGKTFRLVAGEWVDLAFDAAAGLPVVEARSPAERKELLERVPALVPFEALGPRVVVVAEGTVYRFSTPGSR